MVETRLQVRVQPRARRTEVIGFLRDRLRVRVTAPPERGRANEATIELLARALDVPKSRIRLARGAASREKLLFIEGLDDAEVRRRLNVGGDDAADDL